MLELTLVSLSWWVYALAALACVLLSTRAVRRTAGLVGLAILLSQQTLATVAALLAFTSRSPALADFGFQVGTILWLLWSPCAALAGVLLLDRSRDGKAARILAVVTGAPNLVLVLAAVFSPGLVFEPGGASATPLAAAGLSLTFLTFTWVIGLLAREALTTPLPLQRVQLALLAMAFAVEGGFHAFQNASKVLFSFDVHGFEQASPMLTAILVLPAAILLPLTGWVVTRAAGSRSRAARRLAWGIAGCLGIAGLTGALTAPLAAGDEFRDPIGVFHAFWDLAGLLLLVYAAHRFQLVALEERAKQGIAISFAVSCGFVVFGIAQALAERAIQDRYLGTLPANDIIAALAVAIVSIPLVKGGAALGRRVFPQAIGRKDEARRRSEEIYEAAVEGTLLDGVESPLEARSLTSLRRSLGLAEADHARIEARVRRVLSMNQPVSPA